MKPDDALQEQIRRYQRMTGAEYAEKVGSGALFRRRLAYKAAAVLYFLPWRQVRALSYERRRYTTCG